MKSRFVGRHADHLASGKPLAPGDIVELSADEVKQNSRLFDDGLLVDVSESKSKETSSKKKEVES